MANIVERSMIMFIYRLSFYKLPFYNLSFYKLQLEKRKDEVMGVC